MKDLFDHEHLDVYRISLDFVRWSSDLMDAIRERENIRPAKYSEILDHLDRGGLSILFNTAEGNGHRQMKQRAKFFDDARGSATECAACLDALVARRVCVDSEIHDGKVLLLRIVSMLSKLVDRFSCDSRVKEESAEYFTNSP